MQQFVELLWLQVYQTGIAKCTHDGLLGATVDAEHCTA